MSDCPIVRGLKGTRVTVLMDGTTKIRPQLVEDTVELIERLRAELAAERENSKSLNKHITRAKGNTQTMKAERDALRALLLRWDALIEHQYTGSREAMSDMMECAQMTAQTLYGDPPWPTRIDAALKASQDESS